MAGGLDDSELMRIKIDAEDYQDTYGAPQFQDYSDMCGQRGVIRKLAADVVTLLTAMGIEVEDARDE